MLTYAKFIEEVKNGIKEYLPEEYQDSKIYMDQFRKNNNMLKDSFALRRDGETMTPQIYLDEYYQRYAAIGSFDSTISEIAAVIQNSSMPAINLNNINDVFDFDKVKDQVIIQIINMESNQEMLNSMPFKKIDNTDLAAVFRIQLHEDEQGLSSLKVSHEILSHWDTDIDSLYEHSRSNTERMHPFVFNSMENIIFRESINNDEDVLPESLDERTQYVLTNKKGVNGATTLLYTDLMDKLAERFRSDFYILPSSIHEVILMKDIGELNAQELQKMVMEINISEVIPEEVLSNQVFFYDRDAHSLSMATTPEQTNELIEQLGISGSGYSLGMEMEDFLER